MTNHNRVRISKLAIGLAIALAAAPAFAQNTTSALGGRISSTTGQPVSGAEVTIVHTESGSVSRATTDSEGRYVARGLRVGGPYTVTTTKDGKTETREGVYLELAETGNVDIKFADATTLAAVQVTAARAADVFDSKKMGAGTSINREKLTTFASIQRNLQDYARLDPRISQTDKDRGEISAGGQNSRFNSVTIDGVSTNDTFGLEANNLPTAKQPISIDAIQSVQINISNFDVTQKGYTGANINAVTKSGTNDFKGSVYYVYRNDELAGDKFNRTASTFFSPEKFNEDTKGLTFGGPIMEDNLFFFVSYEELKSTRATPTFGPLGSAQTNVAITPAEISGAQTVATGYGMNIGDTTADAAELSVKDALIKIDANLGERHRASLRWSKTEQSDPIFPNNFNNLLSLSSQWYSQDKSIESYVGQWFADWSDSFSTEVKISYRDYVSAPVNNSNLPSIRLNFAGALPVGSPAVANTSSGLIFGTERSRHFNDLSTKTWNYYLAGNLFLGDHELKFGLDYDDNEVFNAFLQDTKGNYTFDCINAAPAAGPNPAFTYNNALINSPTFSCSTATRAQYDAATLENFQRGRPLSYAVQVPINGYSLNDGAADWSYQNIGIFLQDTWTVNENLTLNLGLRFDQKQMDVSPVLNTNALANQNAGTGVLNGSTTPQNGTAVRATGGFGIPNNLTLDGNTLFQPRVGFNYTFDSERPMQLRGGFGLFEGAAANVWLSNVYSNTGITTGIVSCSGTAGSACSRAGGLFSPNPNTQPSIAGTPPSPNVDFLSKDLEQPSVWKANLAFEHELPFFNGATLAIEYIHTEVQDAIYYKNLNLGAPTRKGNDGRDLFFHPVGYNTGCFGYSATGTISLTTTGACALPAGSSRTRALSNSAFNSVLLAERTGKGGGDNLSISLSGAFFKEWNWQVGYAYTTSEEVSSLSSSVSNSSWQSVSVFNANEEVAANSAYLVKDRFTGALNWKHNFFGNYATRFGLFYEGRKGKPYSWIYNNDLNGDNVTNDLMYIPTSQGSGEVCFRATGTAAAAGVATCVNNVATEQLFWNLVNQNGLAEYAGGVVDRNSSYAPWTNNFDVRLSQEMPGFFEGNKVSLTLDILNVGNLINKKWGQIDEVGFQPAGGLARSFVDYLGLDANGRYVYGVTGNVEDLTNRQLKGESSWAAQLTVKYEF
ncbi:MAG: TonB-dependent receptor domain-containing protein [Arenimonas sp.]